jgi:DNA-binding GntR family transcriptional regulator
MTTTDDGGLGGIDDAEITQLLSQFLRLDGKEDSLSSVVALTVARDIIEGRLDVGHDLNSIDLAKQFQSSRTPIREALMVLENSGLVTIPARRRPRVVEPSTRQIREIYSLRAALNAIMAERLATTITESGLEMLQETFLRLKSAAEREAVDDFFWANVIFHDQVATLADDDTLKRSLEGLGLQVFRLRHSSMTLPGRIARSLDDHRRLLRAYQEHDSILASALSRSIVLSALGALIQHTPQPDQ